MPGPELVHQIAEYIPYVALAVSCLGIPSGIAALLIAKNIRKPRVKTTMETDLDYQRSKHGIVVTTTTVDVPVIARYISSTVEELPPE